jgi:hypothetical protein
MTAHLEASFSVNAVIHNQDYKHLTRSELDSLFETDDSIQCIVTQVFYLYAWFKVMYYEENNHSLEYFCILKESYFEWYEDRYGERHEKDSIIAVKVNWQQEGF